jgi:hypothetical protein
VTDDVEIGIEGADTLDGLSHDCAGRTKEKNAHAALLADPRDVMEEIGGCYSLGKRRPMEEAGNKHQRHAISVNKVALKKKVADSRFAGAHGEHLTVRGREDERRQRGIAAAERNIDHEFGRAGTVHHSDGQSTDRGDRHCPSPIGGYVEVNTAGL